jgi:hypothetical protein
MVLAKPKPQQLKTHKGIQLKLPVNIGNRKKRQRAAALQNLAEFDAAAISRKRLGVRLFSAAFSRLLADSSLAFFAFLCASVPLWFKKTPPGLLRVFASLR